MPFHPQTFEYVTPAGDEEQNLSKLNAATKTFAETLDGLLPDGPDKTYALRTLRTVHSWAAMTIMRDPTGKPRHQP